MAGHNLFGCTIHDRYLLNLDTIINNNNAGVSMNGLAVAGAAGVGIIIVVVSVLVMFAPLQSENQATSGQDDVSPTSSTTTSPALLQDKQETDQESVLVSQDDDKIVALASFYPYYEFTRNVAGDRAVVQQFIPHGVAAHDWEMQVSDIHRLQDASVFVYNGLGMESYIESLMDSGEFDGLLFVDASVGVDLFRPGEKEEKDHGLPNRLVDVSLVLDELQDGRMDGAQAIQEIRGIVDEGDHDGQEEEDSMLYAIGVILDEVRERHISQADALDEIGSIVYEVRSLDGDGHGDEDNGHGDEDNGHGDEDNGHGDEDNGHGDEDNGHGDEDNGHGDEDNGHGDEDNGHGDEDNGHGDEDNGHRHDFEYDPHIWLDPIRVKEQVNNIRDGLTRADPGNTKYYTQNAQEYNQRLDELDAKISSTLSSCNKDTLVTFHEAFAYFGERYGLDVVPLSGLAPDAEASAVEIAGFIDFVKDHDINVLFAEELIDPRLAQVIADEAGANVLMLSPIEALAPDEVGVGITYIHKMEQNLDAMAGALECR